MPEVVKHKLMLYADDSTKIVSGKCIESTETELKMSVDNWFIVDK